MHESMSAVSSSVEWLFADVITYFQFLDFQKNLGSISKLISELFFPMLLSEFSDSDSCLCSDSFVRQLLKLSSKCEDHIFI